MGAAQPSDCSPCPSSSFCPTGSITPLPCAIGSYASGGGGQSQDNCALCDINFYCPSTGLTAPTRCPINTFTVTTGGTSKIICRCAAGYSCVYTEHLTATITVKGNLSDFQNDKDQQKTQFINTVAQAAGVPSAAVTIISYTQHTGNRRLLSHDTHPEFSITVSVRDADRLTNLEHHVHMGTALTVRRWSMNAPQALQRASTPSITAMNLLRHKPARDVQA